MKNTQKLIKNGLILTMEKEVDGQLKKPFYGDILIDGAVIAEIGGDLEKKYTQVGTILDGKDALIMPGFVNTHNHIGMSLLRGYGDDLPLHIWLTERVFPVEDKMTAEDIYWGSLLSICEMIRSGTTCFADMYFFMDSVAQAVEETGIRANLSRCVDFSAEKLKQSCDFYQKWQGKAEGRITACLSPHSPYLCPPEFLRDIAAEAKKLGTFLNIHLAETSSEQEDYLRQYGKREIEKLAEIGFFDVPVLGAHLVHIEEKEMELLAQYKVSVAHNPCSNLKLGNGIASVKAMMDKGICVSIGTDGPCSNNNLDMIQELRYAALLQKGIQQNPAIFPAGQVLEMATAQGAKALQLSKEIGQLTVGKKADLIMIDCNKPHLQPSYDVVSDIVYAATGSDVKTMLVDGEILMQDYQLVGIDEEKIIYQAKKCVQKLTE